LRSSTSEYLPRLDHLRFLAALLVLVWHAVHFNNQIATAYVPRFWPLSIFEEGHTGVALFMTLSGFIFQAICRNRQIIYFEFLRNRILRIAPLFLVWTLFLFYTGDTDPSKLFVAILSLLNRDAVPGAGWTIIVEFQFYVIFPFLVVFTRKYGIRYLVGLLLLAILFRSGVWYAQGTVQSLAYWTIFGRFDQFLLGMIGCELYFRRPHWFAQGSLLLATVVLWLWLYHRFNRLGGFYNIGTYPTKSLIWVFLPSVEGLFYAVITASYLGLNKTLPRFLDKSLAWLGSLSYSFYLNHLFVIDVSYKICTALEWKVTRFTDALIFALLIVFPPLVVISAATYYLIELPFLSLRRRYFRDEHDEVYSSRQPSDQESPQFPFERDDAKSVQLSS
jgi:peptidoglycan/LPS O-acetylase OafA/YrhL